MNQARRLLAIALMLCSAATFAQVPRIAEMKPGKYSYNIVTEIPGLPIKPPATSFEQCLTAKELDDGSALRAQRDAGVDCKYRDIKSAPGKYSFKATCTMKEGMKMEMTSEMTASGDTIVMNNTNHMTGKDIPPGMGKSNMRMTMKRLGDCKK
jgi:Protein of unknown function (DUF3617)